MTVKRERALRAAALALGVTAAIAMAELTLRALAPPPDSARVTLENSERAFALLPDRDGIAGGVPFHTNSLGFRGRDISTIVPGRDDVIVVLGDSYAFGYGVTDEQAFPAVLERLLQRAYPDLRVRVLALALPGYNSRQQLATLREFGPRIRPRLVLLAYHLNDTHERDVDTGREVPHAEDSGASRLGLARPRHVAERLREHSHLVRFLLPQLAGLARALHVPVRTSATAELDDYVEGRGPWLRTQVVLQEIFDAARNDLGAGVALMVVPYMVLLTDQHPPAPAYDVVMRFAAAHHVPAVNAFTYFRGRRAGRLWINPFDAHPNAEGHALLAQAASDLVTTHRLIDRP